MAKKNFTIIAMGSNLGDRFDNIRKGFELLKTGLHPLNCSNIYESKALLPKDAPELWNKDFYNCVFSAETSLTPQELFKLCKESEQQVAARNAETWSPRYLDIDIIAFNQDVIKSATLTIPHPRMQERDFVMLPLADILPNWHHPSNNIPASDFIKNSQSSDIKKLALRLHG